MAYLSSDCFILVSKVTETMVSVTRNFRAVVIFNVAIWDAFTCDGAGVGNAGNANGREDLDVNDVTRVDSCVALELTGVEWFKAHGERETEWLVAHRWMRR